MQDSPFRDEGGGTRLHLKPYAKTEQQAWTWHLIGGICGLASGLTACLFGAAFGVLGWLARPGVAATYLQRYSTVLFVLVIPLLLFGAHCLDLQDRNTHTPPPHAAPPPPDTNPPAHPSQRTANPPRTSQTPTRRGK